RKRQAPGDPARLDSDGRRRGAGRPDRLRRSVRAACDAPAGWPAARLAAAGSGAAGRGVPGAGRLACPCDSAAYRNPRWHSHGIRGRAVLPVAVTAGASRVSRMSATVPRLQLLDVSAGYGGDSVVHDLSLIV